MTFEACAKQDEPPGNNGHLGELVQTPVSINVGGLELVVRSVLWQEGVVADDQ